jgi:hypothetical protein
MRTSVSRVFALAVGVLAGLGPGVVHVAAAAELVAEVETFTVPAGLAGGCAGSGVCLVENGSVGSDCTEVEVEDPSVTTSPLGVSDGEGLDRTFCQAFIWADVVISGCTVTGYGALTFQEDYPVGGAAGGSFDFQVSGPLSNAIMLGSNSPGGGTTEDVTVGTISFGSGCTSNGLAEYTAQATFEQG